MDLYTFDSMRWRSWMLRASTLALLAAIPAAQAASPQCDGPENWAAGMTQATLKNAGLINYSEIDFSKTKVMRIASEKIGKDLYRQVHRIIYTKTSGGTLEVIAVNDASHAECSESGVEIFLVGRHFPASP
jgi:hypothetical protein